MNLWLLLMQISSVVASDEADSAVNAPIETSGKEGGDRLLESLFSRAGVHSILEHDEIMDRARTNMTMIEHEASRIASSAARALEESSRLAQQASLGTATWTGRSGSAGKGKVLASQQKSNAGAQVPTR